MTTVFVAITLADADHWPALNEAAARLGASAAVLQGPGPPLTDRLDELSAAGVPEVVLVGVTLGEGGVPTSWVGCVARWWLSRRPDTTLAVRLLPRALRALPRHGVDVSGARALVADPDVLTSEVWEDAPGVHSQVQVCRGPRCTAKGAESVIAALGSELHARGLLDEGVLVTQTGCLFPCNRAPVVAIQPDMAWVGPVTPADVSRIVDRLGTPPAGGRRARTLAAPDLPARD